MEALGWISFALQRLIQWATIAFVILLIVRIFTPTPMRFRRDSLAGRLSALSDPIVFPIHGMLPPGTTVNVATVLAIFVVLILGFLASGVVGGVVGALAEITSGVSSGSPMRAIGRTLDGLVMLFMTMVIVRIIFSWMRVGYYSLGKVSKFIYDVTEPVLAVFRSMIPAFGGMDFSPIVLFFLIQLLIRPAIRMIFG